MVAFARHLEACGFESIVVVEHTVLVTRYDSVYPMTAPDESGWRPTARSPTRSICWRFWPATPAGSGWPPGCWYCPTTIRWCSPNGQRPLMRCRAEDCGCAWAWAGSRKSWRRAVRSSIAGAGGPTSSWRSCGRCGPTSPKGRLTTASSSTSTTSCATPNPLQGERLPVHIGGHSRAAARRAGRFGDGFQPLGVTGPQLASLIALMREEASSAGRDPAALEVSLGHMVTKIDAERAGSLVDQGADRIVLAMPPTTDIEQAKDMLSACAQRLSLGS